MAQFFDVMVCEMWKWLALPPPEIPAGDRHYSNTEFEAIMKRYFDTMRETQRRARERIQQAKEDAKANVHGPLQDDAVPTEIEFKPTEMKVAKNPSAGDASESG